MVKKLLLISFVLITQQALSKPYDHVPIDLKNMVDRNIHFLRRFKMKTHELANLFLQQNNCEVVVDIKGFGFLEIKEIQFLNDDETVPDLAVLSLSEGV